MKYRMYKITVIVFSILTFIFSLYTNKAEGYKFMSIIPGIYVLLFIFAKRLHKYSKQYKGLFILNIYMFLKYSISIFLIALFKGYDIPKYYYHDITIESYRMAIIYIVIEMIAVFLTVELFSDKFYKVETKEEIFNYNNIKIGPILLIFIVISSGLIVIKWRDFIANSLILFSKENSLTESIEVNNFNSIIFHSIKLIITGILINKCICKYKENSKYRYMIYAYLIMAIYVFLSISTSRLNVILPFLLFLLLTKDIFGKRAINLNIGFIGALMICFSIISIYKNPWMYSADDGVSNILIEASSGVQEYTSNIMPTAMGLQAINYYKNEISCFTLINDFFGSVPGISHYVNQKNRIYRWYNMYALNGKSMSQLIPMNVSTIAYFSPAFCWLLVVLNILMLMYIESHIHIKYDNYLENYLLLYLYFIFASCLCSNVQMLSGRFFINFLPSFLILYLNGKIVYKKNKKGAQYEEQKSNN